MAGSNRAPGSCGKAVNGHLEQQQQQKDTDSSLPCSQPSQHDYPQLLRAMDSTVR